MQIEQVISAGAVTLAAGSRCTGGDERGVRIPQQPASRSVVAVELVREEVAAVLTVGVVDRPSDALDAHGLRLRGFLPPLCREVEGLGGARLVARVLALVDAEVPPGRMEIRVRTVRLARGVQALLAVLAGADPATVLYGVRRRPWELHAVRVREAIRLARSWQEPVFVPHPATLRELIHRLREDIAMLLPEAEVYGAGLPHGSGEWQMARQQREDAPRLVSRAVAEDLAQAFLYAADLSETVGVLLRHAEAKQPVPHLFEVTMPSMPGESAENREGVVGVHS